MIKNPFKSFKYNKKRIDWVGYLFVIPALVFFIAFVLIPAIMTFRLALYEWDFLGEQKFVGFENFIRLFQMPEFTMVLGNTLLYTVITVIFKVVGGVILANFVFTRVKGKFGQFIMESSLFMPIVIPMSVVCLLFNKMYDTEYGIFNHLIRMFGGNEVGWLTDPNIALYSVMIVDIFKGIGFFFIIALVAMRNIPKSYYEAADMDGASGITKFLRITIPSMGNTLLFLFVTAFLSSFQVFEPVYLLLDGLFGGTKITLSYMLWQQAFYYRDVGLAAVIAIVVFVAVILITAVQFLISKVLVYNEK